MAERLASGADPAGASGIIPAAEAAGIILAAGASGRLGQPKQLVEVAIGVDGEAGRETLVRRAARLAREAGCLPVVVVLGACDQPCRDALDGLVGVRVVHNADWRDGMASSLRAGVVALGAVAGAEGEGMAAAPGVITIPGVHPPTSDIAESVLVMVTDQARVSAASLARLFAAHRGSDASATAACYGDRLGVPAIFRRQLLPELLALQGDQGARFLLTRLGGKASSVPMPEAAFDLDTPADLLSLRG